MMPGTQRSATRPNEAEELMREVRRRCPEASAELSAPADPLDPWLLEVWPRDGRAIAIEWRPGLGFGVTAAGRGEYRDEPDEFYVARADVLGRVAGLVRSGESTTPRSPARLGALCRERGIGRARLARAAGLSPSALDWVEARGESVPVAILARVVRAMGGRLVVRAEFHVGPARDLDLREIEAVGQARGRTAARRNPAETVEWIGS